MLDVLHELGADFNVAVYKSQWTPLMVAAASGDAKGVCMCVSYHSSWLEVAKLLEKEVRTEHSDSKDRTAEELAHQLGHPDIALLIEQHRKSRLCMHDATWTDGCRRGPLSSVGVCVVTLHA
jgi:hypothetical protein